MGNFLDEEGSGKNEGLVARSAQFTGTDVIGLSPPGIYHLAAAVAAVKRPRGRGSKSASQSVSEGVRGSDGTLGGLFRKCES